MLTFDDGVSFDTSGALRVERRSDGYYVVGRNTLIPVCDRAEGQKMIAVLTKRGS